MKKEQKINKDSFFYILNKAISSPSTTQKLDKKNFVDYSSKRTCQRKIVNIPTKRKNKSY